jgi:predicted nucleotidyltransferase
VGFDQFCPLADASFDLYHVTGEEAVNPTEKAIMGKVQNLTKSYIRQMVKRIVTQFQPDKIILFGSHARGQAGLDSDVDLLIVMPVSGSKREKAIEIAVSLHDIPVAKDVIVVTPDDFEWRSKIVGTIERPAARQGKLLYARK